jgi:hypothetical protein
MYIKNRISKNIIIIYLLLLPYVTFGIFQSDLSPFYLFIVIAYSFHLSKKARSGLLRIIVYSYIILVINYFEENDLRLIKFFASMIIAEGLFYISRVIVDLKLKNIVFIVALVWSLCGFLTLLDPDIFSSLFFRVGFQSNRGGTGLTPEPSYFGISSVFLYAITMELKTNILNKNSINYTNDDMNNLKMLNYSSILFILSVILSASFYAIIVFAIIYLYYRLFNFILLLIFFLLIIIFVDISNFNLDLRIIKLIIELLNNGPEILVKDFSISYRLANFDAIYQSLQGVRLDESEALGSGLTIIFINHGIMGFLTCLILFAISSWRKIVWKLFKNPIMLPLLLLIFIIGPISNPYFWLYLGVSHLLNISKINDKNLIK